MNRSIAILAACAVLAVTFAHAAVAGTIAGTWKISGNEARTVRFDLRSTSENGKHDDEDGRAVTLASLGLTRAQLDGPNGPVSFTLAHDAGDIVCRGTLGAGWGAGTFLFTPSAAYAAAMAQRGSAAGTDREQLAGAMLDVTVAYVDGLSNAVAYVDGLSNAGFTRVPYRDLIGMRALGVTPEYVAAMKSAGVAFAAARETVEARALNVTPD